MDPIQHTLRVSLRGKDNETYSGTLVIRNWTQLMTNQAAHGPASTNSSSSSGIEDPTGASYYVVAVVMVYGFSIVMLIASHIKRKHTKLQEDRQINKYLQEFMVVQERSSRDSYKRLKRSIIAKLHRDKSCTSRSLSKALFPVMAVALPTPLVEPASRRMSIVSSSTFRPNQLTSLEDVAEQAGDSGGDDDDEDVCLESIAPGMDPALVNLTDTSDTDAENTDHQRNSGWREDWQSKYTTQLTHQARVHNEREIDVPVSLSIPIIVEPDEPSPPPEPNFPAPLFPNEEEFAPEPAGRRTPSPNTLSVPGTVPQRTGPPSRPKLSLITRPSGLMQEEDPELFNLRYGHGMGSCSPLIKDQRDLWPATDSLYNQDASSLTAGEDSDTPRHRSQDEYVQPGLISSTSSSTASPSSSPQPGSRRLSQASPRPSRLLSPSPTYDQFLSPKSCERSISPSPRVSPYTGPEEHQDSPRHSPRHATTHSPRHSPRDSPRHSPRHSPRPSPNPSPLPSPRRSRTPSPLSTPSRRVRRHHSPCRSPTRSAREPLLAADFDGHDGLSSPEREQLLHVTCV